MIPSTSRKSYLTAIQGHPNKKTYSSTLDLKKQCPASQALNLKHNSKLIKVWIISYCVSSVCDYEMPILNKLEQQKRQKLYQIRCTCIFFISTSELQSNHNFTSMFRIFKKTVYSVKPKGVLGKTLFPLNIFLSNARVWWKECQKLKKNASSAVNSRHISTRAVCKNEINSIPCMAVAGPNTSVEGCCYRIYTPSSPKENNKREWNF